MSLVSILAVDVLDNPSSFLNPFQFEVTFECLKDLKEGAFCALYACACVCARASGRPFVVLFRLLLLTKKKKRAPISRRCARAHTDLEWKIVYIGSAESEDYDQVLDDILVGPVTVGTKKFVFQVSASRARANFSRFLVVFANLFTLARIARHQAPPPDVSKLPEGELLGVTVVLLTCSYKSQEFIRVGTSFFSSCCCCKCSVLI